MGYRKNTSVRQSGLFVLSRVRFAGEIRIGAEKVPCPSCNQDCWLPVEKVYALDRAGRTDIEFLCRECQYNPPAKADAR